MEIYKYDLPAGLGEYKNEFIPEKEIKDSFLYEHPVPDNIQVINRMDSFMQDILKDKGFVFIYKLLEIYIANLCNCVVYWPQSNPSSCLFMWWGRQNAVLDLPSILIVKS